MEHDPDDPRLPDSLIGELSRLYRVDVPVSPEVDRAIVNRARAHLARGRRMRWVAWGAGVAASIAVATSVLLYTTQPRRMYLANDLNRDGVVNILDAMALQRGLDDGSNERHDTNGDGVTDRRDVDAIAMAAVQLR